jgi:hypothetical protein
LEEDRLTHSLVEILANVRIGSWSCKNPRVHHDALVFADGTYVLLTDLLDGQEATVLELPAQPKTPAEEAAQRRVSYVG